MTRIWDTDNTKCWQGCGATGAPSLLVGMQNNHFGRKLNTLLPCDPAIMLLGTYPKESKTYVHIKTCTWNFMAVLFIIAKTWKQSKCPSVSEWINKLWYFQTVEYYSSSKKEWVIHEMMWRKLKWILLDNLKKLYTIWLQLYDSLYGD